MSRSFKLARRLDGVSESATLKLNALVNQMKAQGVDVINFSAGEPDFSVPQAAKDAVKAAVDANKSKYTPSAGIPELREAIALKTNAQQPSVAATQPWKASDVIVTNGGKQALFNAFLALLDPGDEVLIPAPFWLSYPEMTKLANGVPRLIQASFAQGFKINPTQLRAALSDKTKILMINSPSNPTGAMYSRAELAALGEVLLTMPGAEGVWVISDEIYDRISFNDRGDLPFTSFLEACPALRDRVITVNGMSKSAAMTGWRVGWSVAPSLVTQGMNTLQGQSTSGINALAQWASVAALNLPESEFRWQVESFRKRRDLVLEILQKAAKLELSIPQGAFYVFVGVKQYFKTGSQGVEDSMGFCERLLEGAKVAAVPGTPFGEPDFIRLSFATDERTIQEGCERIVKFLEG
ncbi:pyridoxal phosphate-dependent aminotransferase [Bdellovibrionota bacterium FG-1]